MTLSWWPCHKIVSVTFTFYICMCMLKLNIESIKPINFLLFWKPWGAIPPAPSRLHWLVPHHSSPPEHALQGPHCLYKICVLTHMVRVGRSPAYLSDMMTSVADHAWSWETEILQQLPIWTSTVETEVWRAEFLVLRNEGMEFSSVQSPGTHKHCLTLWVSPKSRHP